MEASVRETLERRRDEVLGLIRD